MRRLQAAGLALAMTVSGLALTTPPAQAAVALPAPAVSPVAPLVGEKVTLTGTLGRTGKRTVRLQRFSNGWRTVTSRTSDSRGRWTFTYTPRSAVSLRVVSPRTKTRDTRITAKTRVTPVADRMTLRVAEQAVTATASAPRAGRTMTLQTRVPGQSWTSRATARQDAKGRTTFSTGRLPEMTHHYRVVASAWRGAPPATSPTTRFAAPTDVVPDAPVALDLTTTDSAEILKETYVPGTVRLDGITQTMRIKGRGNTTWGNPKKPYRIKLDASAQMLGMPADKDWVLLANYNDRSLLRTHLAMALGHRTSLAWTPRTRFVDVTLNGEPRGSYVLTEQVEPADERARVKDGGMLLEVDGRFQWAGEPGYVTGAGIPLAYKDPDAPSAATRDALHADVKALEASLYAKGGPTPAWRSMVDLDAAADWYLVNELFKNVDSDFWSSVYLTWDPRGRFTLGPLWDFDLSAGVANGDIPALAPPSGWYLRGDASLKPDWPRHADHWLVQMLEDPVFLERVEDRWRALSPVVHAMTAQTPAAAAAIGPSAAADWDRWAADWHWFPGSLHGNTYAAEVDFLETWLETRATWMDQQIG